MPVNLTDNEELMQRMKGSLEKRLFVLAGPSGVGKNTIIKELLATHPEFGRIRTYTTRPSRGEYENKQYRFVSRDEFTELHADGKLLEDHDVYGSGDWYSMPTDLFQDIQPDQHIVIAEVDVEGTKMLCDMYDDVVSIFIMAPPLELMTRIANRQDEAMTPERLKDRFDTAKKQIQEAKRFDYIVFNRENHFCRTVSEIESIILAERLRVQKGLDLEPDAEQAFELVNQQLYPNGNGSHGE